MGGRVARHDALELQQRLLVEDDVVQVVRVEVGGHETVVGRAQRQAGIVLESRKALFFGGRNQLTVAQQARSSVVVEAGQSEDVQNWRRKAVRLLSSVGRSIHVEPPVGERSINRAPKIRAMNAAGPRTIRYT